jgi:hypothetical protein
MMRFMIVAPLALLTTFAAAQPVGQLPAHSVLGRGATPGPAIALPWSSISQVLSAKTFGADPSLSDNTTQFTAALAQAKITGQTLYIPGGTGAVYLTDKITYTAGVNNQPGIVCEPGTTLKKKTANADPIFLVGDATGNSYTQIPDFFSGCVLDANSSGGDGVVAYDLIRTQSTNLRVKNAVNGIHLYGGIIVTFYSPMVSANTTGFKIETFTSVAGGVPNIITLNSPIIVDNTLVGLYYRGGNQLFVNNSEIEGNGTNGNANAGGAYIEAVSAGVGAVFNGGWFESNAGGFNLWFNGGNNSASFPQFINSPLAANDVKITAGTYSLTSPICVAAKTVNINETTVSSGNAITDPQCTNITYSSTRTRIISAALNSKVNLIDTPYNHGAVSSGTLIPDATNGRSQLMVANGAFTLSPPASPSEVFLQIYNSPLAGAITTSGFSKVTGSYASTNGLAYLFRITKTQNYSLLEILPAQ